MIPSEHSGPPTRPVVLVMLPHGLDVRHWRRRFHQGDVLDETPYGYGAAGDAFDLRWSVDHRETRFARLARRAIVHAVGADLVHVWRNRALFRGTDVVWTHTEDEHLAIGLLRNRLGEFRLLAQTVWLWDRWPHLTSLRRTVLRRLLARADVEVVLSRVNREVGAAAVPARRIVRVPFGTETLDDAQPAVPRRMIFAPGNDRDRDWAVLLGAARLLPDVEFLIASASPFFTPAVRLPPNVRRERRLGREAVAAAYREAAAVVVPLRPNSHASGVTVAIEALARGCPLVVSDVGGLDEYVGGCDGAMVPPDDPAALAAAIRPLADDPHRSDRNRALPVERGLTQQDYVRRIELLSRFLLDGRWNPAIEEFTPVRA